MIFDIYSTAKSFVAGLVVFTAFCGLVGAFATTQHSVEDSTYDVDRHTARDTFTATGLSQSQRTQFRAMKGAIEGHALARICRWLETRESVSFDVVTAGIVDDLFSLKVQPPVPSVFAVSFF